jgi:hypothetical protein
MMKKMLPSRRALILGGFLILVPLALLLLAYSVGSGPAERMWTNAPGWSRAKLIGTTNSDLEATQPVPIAVDDAGVMYLLLAHKNGAAVAPRMLALNRQTEVVWDRSLDIAARNLQQPQLIARNKQIVLLWIDQQHLYSAQLDNAGHVQTAPTRLSGDEAVDSYAAATNDQGAITVWYGGSRETPGVYAIPAGHLAGKAQLVDDSGMQPTIQYDSSGKLHAVWMRDRPDAQDGPSFYYASYADEAISSDNATVLTNINLADASINNPVFGLDQQHGYLFWTVSVKSGMSAGAIVAQYLSFPLNAPANASPVHALDVPEGAHLQYHALPEDELQAGPRVALASEQSGRTAPLEMHAGAQSPGELVIACNAQILYKYHETMHQTGALFFRNGVPSSYQLISFSPHNTYASLIASDHDHYLYTTWLELSDDGFNVYLASTAPDIKQALQQLTLSDIGHVGFDVMFGLISGALFAPFAALMWSIASLLVLAATWFVRRDRQSLAHWATRLSLVAALLVYWLSKMVILPSAMSYAPFSAWIPAMPAWLSALLQVVVPVGIFMGALWIAWRYTYQRGIQSAVLFIAIYIGIDSVCTMAIYGGLLFGAFYPVA